MSDKSKDTAAAEVGEPSKMFAYISGQSEGKIAELEAREEYALGHLGSQIEENEKLRAELAAIIERCAQVALEWLRENGYEPKDLELVAAIRALKNEL